MKKELVVEIASFLFTVLFLYAGVSKLLDYSIFKEQIAASPILAPIASLIAILIPAVEITLSVVLFFPRWRYLGLRASLTLMIAFTLYITGILFLNKHIPCSCGGIISNLSWGGHLVLNIGFILLALLALSMQKRLNHPRVQLNTN